jgi:hypothetical protein
MTTKKKPAERNKTCIFTLLKDNENLLTQADLLLAHSFKFINEIDIAKTTLNSDSISFVINLLKSKLKKEKNLQIDPLFCLSYSLLYLFNKSIINTTSSKVLFSFAGIYSELLQSEKSCYAIIKHFELQHRLEKSIGCNIQSSVWIENEFKEAYKNISNIHQGIKDLISLTFHTLGIVKLIKDENQMNFFILFLNNLISLPEETEYIQRSYSYLESHKQEIKSFISQMHFNNLVKILCKMSESLLKKQINYEQKSKCLSLLVLSNKINILLNEFLFTCKYSNKETTVLFVTNEINELLRLIISKNISQLIYNEQNFLTKSHLCNLFDNITSGLEKLLSENEYLNIIGKIYNFLYNLNSNMNNENLLLNHKVMQFYSDKILNFYKQKQIIINETLMIKVLIFKEYLSNNKLKMTDNSISDKIGEHIDELNILIRKLKLSSNSDLDYFFVIIRFLLKCFDNLIIVLVNNLEKFYNLWTLSEKIESLFEYFLIEKKEIFDKNKEYFKFLSFIKILNLSGEDMGHKFMTLLKAFSENFSNDSVEIKNRINILIIYFLKCCEFDNVITLLKHFSLINFEIFSNSYIYTISSLDKFKVKLFSESNADAYFEKVILIVDLFLFNLERTSLFVNEKIILSYEKLEKILIFTFKLMLQRVRTKTENSKFLNDFLPFISWMFKFSDRINKIYDNYDSNLGCIAFLELIEFILYLQEGEEKIRLLNIIYEAFKSNIFEKLMLNQKIYLLLKSIFHNILIQNTLVINFKLEETQNYFTENNLNIAQSSLLITIFEVRKNLVEKTKNKISHIVESILNQSGKVPHYFNHNKQNNFNQDPKKNSRTNKITKVYESEMDYNQLSLDYFFQYEKFINITYPGKLFIKSRSSIPK